MEPTKPVKLNIGSSIDVIDGYTSVDLFMPADIKDDITTLATIATDSVDEVLTTHVLEHLKNDDVPKAMASVFRVLKPGGRWIIEVPDLNWVLNDFINTPEKDRWGWKLQTLFGLQSHDGEYHKTGYSDWRMGQMLKDTGFVRIQIDTVFSEKYNQGVIDAIAIKP